MTRKLINYLGILGVVSFVSYVMAITLSPLAYPGYNWMSQAVSDLFAVNSPSLNLWNQLTVLYSACGMVSVTLVSVFIENRLNKTMRTGIHLFTIMNWISCIGYGLFPLSSSGFAGTFQDIIHTYVVTLLVVLFSIVSLMLIIIGGFRDRKYISLSRWALCSLIFMFIGAIGVGVVPPAYFGIPERFSVLSATFFNAVLGVYLFHDFRFPNSIRVNKEYY